MNAAALHDPRTYASGVPFELIEQLRARGPVVWIDEPALPGLPAGPGYHLVLDHALVSRVLKDAATFSSAVGGTQIRDPASPEDLGYVQKMMLNMDPPEHSRLRKLLARSFTPAAVAALEGRIARHAREIVDRMLAGPAECDFAKHVAADLPLLALADVLGVPAEDRWLMFDWSNRVIGFLDPDYASSSAFDASTGSELAREALAVRPTGPTDPRSRAGIAGSVSLRAPTGRREAPRSGRRRDVDPARAARRRRDVRGRVREHVLAVRESPATRPCATACPAA